MRLEWSKLFINTTYIAGAELLMQQDFVLNVNVLFI